MHLPSSYHAANCLLFPVPLGWGWGVPAGLCPSMFLVAPPRPWGAGSPLPCFLPTGRLLGLQLCPAHGSSSLGTQPLPSAPPPSTAVPKCPSALVLFHSLAPPPASELGTVPLSHSTDKQTEVSGSKASPESPSGLVADQQLLFFFLRSRSPFFHPRTPWVGTNQEPGMSPVYAMGASVMEPGPLK